MIFFVILCALACAGLVFSERAGSSAGIWLCKPVASSAFVGAALVAGAPATAYAQFVLTALLLSWLGDALLIPRKHPRVFLSGMVSFLLAHVSYGLAFWSQGPDPRALVIAAPLVGASACLVLRWLGPRLLGVFRIAVPAYIAAIAAMLILAISISGGTDGLRAAVGATLFAASDILVARDRFVAPGWRNRAAGLPLYYAAQLILAGTLLH